MAMIEKNRWYICHTQFGLCDVGFKVKYTDYINRNGLRFVDENGMYYSITFEEIERYFTPIDVNEKNIKENNMMQEQKAQAYDEALERAKNYYKANQKIGEMEENKMLSDIFPELIESEDELTWLTNFIKEEAYYLSIDIRDNEDRIKLKKLQQSLAWLEKQKPVEWSEEDEKKFSDILALLRGGENCHYNTPELFDWLKSLKEKIQNNI